MEKVAAELGFDITYGNVVRLTLRKNGKLFLVTVAGRKASAIVMGKNTKRHTNKKNEKIGAFLERITAVA